MGHAFPQKPDESRRDAGNLSKHKLRIEFDTANPQERRKLLLETMFAMMGLLIRDVLLNHRHLRRTDAIAVPGLLFTEANTVKSTRPQGAATLYKAGKGVSILEPP